MKQCIWMIGAAVLTTAFASACDLCAVYNVNAAEGSRKRGFSLAAAEQFTHFGTVQRDGREVRNRFDQHLNSSISQVVLGYTFNDWASAQVNVPIIHREFRRFEDGIDHGRESGLGDVSLIAVFTPVRVEQLQWTFNWSWFGGVKFPTGDSDRIGEEIGEEEPAPGFESGVHGHDLALGTGSYDGLIGMGIYARYRRGFFRGSVQYSIRSRGDFDYRYANDLNWSGGPGVFLVLKEEWTASLQLVASGEDKGLDRFRGESVDDSGITSVFLGPQLGMTWGGKLSAEAGVDLPVLLDNTAFQAVPDYRIRAAVTYRF